MTRRHRYTTACTLGNMPSAAHPPTALITERTEKIPKTHVGVHSQFDSQGISCRASSLALSRGLTPGQS
jgi:hypothetical protein